MRSDDNAQAGRDPLLEQLAYVSVGAVRVSSGLQMADILAEARPNNARDGITGVLTAVDGWFVQVVEGPGPALDDLLERLARDTRHRDLRLLDRRDVDERAFARWDMVSPRLAQDGAARLLALLNNGDPDMDALILIVSDALKDQEARLEEAGFDVWPDTAPPGPGAGSEAWRDRES